MKKKELLVYILTPILLLGVTITIIVAWYTNTHKIGNIEGETSDIVISYTLNGQSGNVTDYSVSNLTFFDIDNSNETNYFLDMVTIVELDIENVTNNDLSLTIGYSYTPKYQYSITSNNKTSNIFNTTLPSGMTAISEAYCYGFITEKKLTSKNESNDGDIDNTLTIRENIKNYSSNISNVTIKGNTTYTYYLYLFGVQAVDLSNNDFLKEKYNFTLKIQSFVSNTNPSETTTTKKND